jgi:hypothetical protein
MRSGVWQRFRHFLLAALLVLGAATAWSTHSARGWWDTDVPRLLSLRDTAAAIDTIPGAIVVTDITPLNLLEFARYLRPETGLRLGATAPASLIGEEWSRVVLVAPSPTLLEAMRKGAAERGASLEKWRSGGEGYDLWRVAAVVPLAVDSG